VLVPLFGLREEAALLLLLLAFGIAVDQHLGVGAEEDWKGEGGREGGREGKVRSHPSFSCPSRIRNETRKVKEREGWMEGGRGGGKTHL